jgi:hypothetical protein
VMSTCMNSFPPICWWNGVEHLSTSMSSKPRHKNITFGWFEISRWRTRRATTAHLKESNDCIYSSGFSLISSLILLLVVMSGYFKSMLVTWSTISAIL